jgi:hypothetical protein
VAGGWVREAKRANGDGSVFEVRRGGQAVSWRATPTVGFDAEGKQIRVTGEVAGRVGRAMAVEDRRVAACSTHSTRSAMAWCLATLVSSGGSDGLRQSMYLLLEMSPCAMTDRCQLRSWRRFLGS